MPNKLIALITFAVLITIGVLASQGVFGPTGSPDPCLDLQGEEREGCANRR